MRVAPGVLATSALLGWKEGQHYCDHALMRAPKVELFPQLSDLFLVAVKYPVDSGGQAILLCVWGTRTVSAELRHKKQDVTFSVQ